MDSSRQVRFSGWTLDRPAGELRRGETRVRLQSQPLKVLEALLERPGELVTREELIALLWPNGVVDYDTALNTAVRRLRVTLEDDADQPLYIETIPRRGYRFIAAVEAPSPPPALPAGDVATGGRASTQPDRAASEGHRSANALVIALALTAVAVGAAAWLHNHPQPTRLDAEVRQPAAAAQERERRARHLLQRRESGDTVLARKYFSEAVVIDPEYGQAWAGLASAYWLETVLNEMPPEQGLGLMRDAAERALAIDPRLAEAHLRLALYWGLIGEPARREHHMRLALELEPDNPLVLGTQAMNLVQQDLLDDAVDLQQRAVAAEPLSMSARYNLAWILLAAGRLEEATATLLELRELNPTTKMVAELLGILLVLQGRFDSALESVSHGDADDQLFVRALAYHGLGRMADADEAARAFTELAGEHEYLRLAELFSYRGDHDAAFAQLELAVAAPALRPWQQNGSRPAWMARYSPLLRPLHADPRWNDWLATLPASPALGLDPPPTLRGSD